MPRKRTPTTTTTVNNVNTSRTSKRRKLAPPTSHPPPSNHAESATADLIATVNALSLSDFHAKYWPHDIIPTLFPSSTTATNGSTPKPNENLEVDFKLTSPSHFTSSSEFNACFHLIESMNARDYRASEIGWSPEAKRTEMLDPVMKYLLLVGDCEGRDGKGVEGRGMARFGGLEVATRRRRSGWEDEVEDVLRNGGPEEKEDAGMDPNVLGFVSFQVTQDDSVPARSALYIYEIHLSPRLQGLGIGPRLISLVEHLGRKIGVEKSMLTVFRRNQRARLVYQNKCGWEVDETSPEEKEMRNGKRRDLGGYVILSKRLR